MLTLFNREMRLFSFDLDKYELLGIFVMGIIPYIFCWVLKYIFSGSVSITPLNNAYANFYYKFIVYVLILLLWFIFVNLYLV